MRPFGLLVAVPLLSLVLAGCLGGPPETGPVASDPAAASGAANTMPHASVGPDDGWLRFPGEPGTDTFVLEGSFQPHEGATPANVLLNSAGMGQHAPANTRLHDISDRVPADQPVWIWATLTYQTANGGMWVNGPNEAFWVYDATGQGDGMQVTTIITRGADDALEIGVWYGSAEPAAEVAYSVEVNIHINPEWFPSALAYGFDLERFDTLELRFANPAPARSVWVWDAADAWLGAFSPAGDAADVLHIAPAWEALGGAAGEVVVFVTEGTPAFQARVLTPHGTRPAEFRILDQVIVRQGPWSMTGGTTTTTTFEVPVQPFQVGYSFFVPELVIDVAVTFDDPNGTTIHESGAAGPNALGLGGFHNTDMGVPRMPLGTYTLTYTDTQSKDARLDGWYVTYGR